MKDFICEICQKNFRVYAYQRKGKHITCSYKCAAVIRSKEMRGKQPKNIVAGWNKGKKVWWTGEKHPNYKGKTHNGMGYIRVFSPEHPFRDKMNYVLEHRLVMEKHIGRYLLATENVHHINHVRNDNRLENLQLFTKSDHMKLHDKQRIKNNKNQYI